MKKKLILAAIFVLFAGLFPLSAQIRISISAEKMPVEQFLSELEEQGDFTFFYSKAVLEGLPPVTVNAKDLPLQQVLETAFKGSGLSFTPMGSQIAIRKERTQQKEESPSPESVKPDKRVVRGRVTDLSGEPVAYASVIVTNAPSKATLTDEQGSWSLELKEEDAILNVSYIGFVAQNIVVNGRDEIDVTLTPDASNMLEETVVIGYGIAKKQDLTGSVAAIKMADIQAVPVTSVSQALQGRVAGVDIVGASGAPGAASSINIRGARSITASNEPLIVVDGVMDAVTDLGEINPSDIQNISVLKDASSTAIYGSKGANGVIMVTTKQGMSSKPQVSFKTEFGLSRIARKLDLMNAEEFIRYRNSSSQLNNLNSASWLPPYDAADYSADTDWINTITRLAKYQNYWLSLSGGSKGTSYYGALAYTDEDGIVSGSGMRRFSGRVNLSHQFYKWLKLFLNISANNTRRDLNKAKFGGTNISNGAMYLAPIIGPLDDSNPLYENGVLINTPYASIKYEEFFSEYSYSNNTIGIHITPVKNLMLKSWNSYALSGFDEYHFWPSWMPKKQNAEGADARRYSMTKHRLATENTLVWKHTFGTHYHFDALGGFSASVTDQLSQTVQAKSMLDDEAKWKNFAAIGSKENYTISSSYWDQRKMSFFTRVNLDYAKKYYLTLTLRTDGSSNFAENNKWGFFPSVAVKWDIRREPFLKSVRWLNQLALRGSYGRTGNDAIASYRSLQAYATTSSYIFDGIKGVVVYPSRLANPDLTWEKTDQLNLALETSFFSQRLNLTIEGYSSKTTDLLLNVSLMNTTGYSSRLSNLGMTSNKGFELTLESRNFELSKFGWTSVLTLSHNRQLVEDTGHYDYVPTVTSAGNLKYMMYGYKQGYPLNSLWGFKYGGVVHNLQEFYDNQRTHTYVYREILTENNCLGHSRYIDQNGDAVLDNNDLVYLGNADPVIAGGIQNNFYIGKFKLSVFFNCALGGKIYNYSELYMAGGLYSNQYRYMLNSWHPTRNPDSDIPRAGDTANVMLPSTFQVHDASWVRLQDLSLEYSFDLRKTKIFKTLSLGVSGRNLWLWTRYNGFDPDVSAEEDGLTLRRVDMNAYPAARRVVFSLNLKM